MLTCEAARHPALAADNLNWADTVNIYCERSFDFRMYVWYTKKN